MFANQEENKKNQETCLHIKKILSKPRHKYSDVYILLNHLEITTY